MIRIQQIQQQKDQCFEIQYSRWWSISTGSVKRSELVPAFFRERKRYHCKPSLWLHLRYGQSYFCNQGINLNLGGFFFRLIVRLMNGLPVHIRHAFFMPKHTGAITTTSIWIHLSDGRSSRLRKKEICVPSYKKCFTAMHGMFCYHLSLFLANP